MPDGRMVPVSDLPTPLIRLFLAIPGSLRPRGDDQPEAIYTRLRLELLIREMEGRL